MRRRLILGVAPTTVLALAAVGCGNSPEGSDQGSPVTNQPSGRSTPAQAPPGGGGGQPQTVRISGTDFRLSPAQPQVSPGKVRFEFVNRGQVTHALEVEGPAGEMETEDLEAGGRGSFTIDLNRPGSYIMYCPVGSHRQQGMEGRVVVG